MYLNNEINYSATFSICQQLFQIFLNYFFKLWWPASLPFLWPFLSSFYNGIIITYLQYIRK